MLQAEVGRRDDELSVLTEKLQAAHLELKVGGSALGRKNEELLAELAATKAALAQAQKQLETQLLAAAQQAVKGGGKALGADALAGKAAVAASGPDTLGFFHNTCLLVKVLMSRGQAVANLPIDDLYETVLAQKLPIEEWPSFIYQRYSHSAATAAAG